LQLTEEGELFLGKARAILDAMEEAEESVTRGRERPSGKLRVDAASPFMLHGIAPHMAEFADLYPEIRLELSSNERDIDLLEQKVDIAIRIGTLQDSTLHARALGSSRIRVVASPAYLARYGEPRSVDALRAHRLAGFTAPDLLNQWPLPDGARRMLKIEPGIRASSGETLRQLVIDGWGIACLADFMTAGDIREGRLVPVLGDLLIDSRQPIHAVFYQSASLAGRVKCFLDFIAPRLRL
jgi:DNA-binding transcriptional LysR family regulator